MAVTKGYVSIRKLPEGEVLGKGICYLYISPGPSAQPRGSIVNMEWQGTSPEVGQVCGLEFESGLWIEVAISKHTFAEGSEILRFVAKGPLGKKNPSTG